jgi:hypothetical protein
MRVWALCCLLLLPAAALALSLSGLGALLTLGSKVSKNSKQNAEKSIWRCL